MLEDLLIENDTPYLLNRVINEECVFDNDNYKVKFLELESSEFKNNVTFKDTNLKCGIHFRKCNFYGNLKFEGVIISDYDTRIQHLSESLIFEDCKFFGEVVFSHNTSILRNLVFKKRCEFFYALRIINAFITEGGVNIEDCTFDNIIDIQRSRFNSQLSIVNTKVNSLTRIVSVSSNTISFTGNNDFQRGRIELCQVENGLVFNDGVFNGDWEINACRTRKHGLTLFSSSFKTSLTIKYQQVGGHLFKIEKFYIRECIFGNGMYVFGNNGQLTPNKSIIDSIDIKLSTSMKGEISFQELDVGIIKLSGVNTGCNLVLRSINVNKFEIETLTNSSGLILSYLNKSNEDWSDSKDNSKKIDSLLKIDDSNLGKAQLHAIDFTGFKDVIISGSILTDISVSLIEWFKIDKLNNTSIKDLEKLYENSLTSNDETYINNLKKNFQRGLENKKDTLRQLKVVSQRQLDNPKALYFQRHEMSLHKEILDLEKDSNFGDWFIFWSNKYSNDFGQNWIRAVFCLLIASFLCYIPIAILSTEQLNQSQFMSSCSDLRANVAVIFDFNQMKQWIVLLNPTHRIFELFDKAPERISTIIYIVDFISRIFVAYFVFQLISAFRKFNK